MTCALIPTHTGFPSIPEVTMSIGAISASISTPTTATTQAATTAASQSTTIRDGQHYR